MSLPIELWEYMYIEFGVSGCKIKAFVKEFDISWNSARRIQRYFRNYRNTKPQIGNRVLLYGKSTSFRENLLWIDYLGSNTGKPPKEYIKMYGTVITTHNNIVCVSVHHFSKFDTIEILYNNHPFSLNCKVITDWCDKTYTLSVINKYKHLCRQLLRIVRINLKKELLIPRFVC